MNEITKRFASEHAPCYVYAYDELRGAAQNLQENFPDYTFLFSVKANPFPPVVRALAGLGIGADAASAGEVRLAKSAGMRPIYFSAAGKSDSALRETMDACTLIADSLGEVERIAAIAAERGRVLPIGIRINPGFGMGTDTGSAGKFGIDEEALPALCEKLRALPAVTVCGIHVHVKSQNLDADVLGRYYQNCFELALRTQKMLNTPITFINFGGGIGVVYDETRGKPLDFARLRTYTDAIAEENRRTLGAKLLIESGRGLTAKMGTYYLRVVDVKESRGEKYVIVENCMNGLQKPAIAAMLRHLVPEGALAPQEPMFTAEYAFPITALSDSCEEETVHIVGNLCCAQDILCDHFTGPKLSVGDLIAVGNAGAYACTLTAQRFSSHDAPGEYLLDADGKILP